MPPGLEVDDRADPELLAEPQVIGAGCERAGAAAAEVVDEVEAVRRDGDLAQPPEDDVGVGVDVHGAHQVGAAGALGVGGMVRRPFPGSDVPVLDAVDHVSSSRSSRRRTTTRPISPIATR